jgi:DNA polymerase III delta prime subunit
MDFSKYFEKIIEKDLIDGSWLFLGIDEEAKLNFVLDLAKKISDASNIFIISPLFKAGEDLCSRFQVWEPSIESVRQAIRFLSLTTPNKKVFIVNSVESLQDAAQNALLKTVEEPNNNSVLFFLAKSENRILPTLCSRMRAINLPVFDRKKYFQKRFFKGLEEYLTDVKNNSGYFKKIMALDDEEKIRFVENITVLLRDKMLDLNGVPDLKTTDFQGYLKDNQIRESLKTFSRLEDTNVNIRLHLENLIFKISG